MPSFPVAWSDFLQGLLVAVGSTAMAIWAVVKVGGVVKLFTELASIDPLLVSMTNGAAGLALFGGMVLVSALGLIMSTADSQLLISGTAVSRDFIERTLGTDLTDRQSELVARAAVGAVGIFGIWVAALGATFGPALLASL